MRLFHFVCFLSAVAAHSQLFMEGSFKRDGRTMAWALANPDDLDLSKPQAAYIFVHGNNRGTQQEILDMFLMSALAQASRLKALGLVVASPDTCTEDRMRCWNLTSDPKLLLAALRSGFDQTIRIDTTRVYLNGASQGGCFLDALLQSEPFRFGGGVYHECGCHTPDYSRYQNPDWTRSFKVFVSSTQEDYLYPYGVNAADFHRWWEGYDVRSSFARTGGHCQTHAETRDSALDWISGRIQIPSPPFAAHWERLLPLPGVKSLAALASGDLVMGTMGQDTSRVWQSTNSGRDWKQIWSMPDDKQTMTGSDGKEQVTWTGLVTLASVEDVVVVSRSNRLIWIHPNGSVRETASPLTNAQLRGDRMGGLWACVVNQVCHRSLDSGKTWKAISPHWFMAPEKDKTALENKAWEPFFHCYNGTSSKVYFPGPDFAPAESLAVPGELMTAVRHGSEIFAATWDGSRKNLYRWTQAQGWILQPWPADGKAMARSDRWPIELEMSSDGRLLVFGNPSLRQRDDGSWERMPGGAFFYGDEPGLILPDGRMISAMVAGDGLMIWVPRADLSMWSSVRRPASQSRSALQTRVEGRFLILPPGGTWAIRWFDASGRTLSRQTATGGTRLNLHPFATIPHRVWVEVASPGVRETLQIFH
jgi:hypothetical protein